MNWKDTVMNETELKTIYMDTSLSAKLKDISMAAAKAQAELSFKAGYEQRESEFVYNPDYLKFKDGVKTGRQLGRREVAEWAMKYYESKCVLMSEEGKAQLKKWGIK